MAIPLPYLHLNLVLIGFVVMIPFALGCGSSKSVDSEPQVKRNFDSTEVGEAAAKSEEASKAPEQIYFQLRLNKPIEGRVVATRTLVRQKLDTLYGSIEWPIRLEPDGSGGFRVLSGRPKVSPLDARIPEDAINQLLIGRMFLASGVIDVEGEFSADAGTVKSVEALHDAIIGSRPSSIEVQAAREFLGTAVSTEVATTVTRGYWKTMIQSLQGKNWDIGSRYEIEAPSELPTGGEVVFVSEVTVTGRRSCVSDATGTDCVRIVTHSRPKGSILEAVRESAKSHIPAGYAFERFDLTADLVQVLDPSSLIPYSLQMVKKTDGSARFPNGVSVPIKELSREEWQFEWAHD